MNEEEEALFEAKRILYYLILKKKDLTEVEINLSFELAKDETIQAHFKKRLKAKIK